MERKHRILVIEEDKQLSQILINYLSSFFELKQVTSTIKALKLLETEHFDIAILDLKCSYNLSLCRKIKIENKTHVIILSGASDICTKEKCFEAGCDDFLAKPFIPKELLLRINKLLGKYNQTLVSTIGHKGMLLNTATQCMSFNTSKIYLSNTEYLIMEYLFLSLCEIKTEKLLAYLSTCKNKQVSNSALTVQIKRMRDKFEKALGMEIIKTRYGRGYYLGL